jgi:hypothetical protein
VRVVPRAEREAEIEDRNPAVVADKDIIGLQISMDNAGRVDASQALEEGLYAFGERLPGPPRA